MATKSEIASRPWHRLSKALGWQKESRLYKSLDSKKQEFRVLVLFAGSGDDPVKAELRPARLKDGKFHRRPRYETISYCWGDPNNLATIELNSIEVLVPASSAAAVRCVRLPNRDRVIWIDALCINQENLKERAQQVAMMGDIYSSSNGNLVYLGEADAMAVRAVSSIHAIIADIKRRTNDFDAVEETPFELQNKLYLNDVRCGADEESLIAFYSNDWFRRVWAFQEASLAPWNECFLGRLKLDLLDILRAALWVCYHPQTYSYDLRSIQGIKSALTLQTFVDKQFGFHNHLREPKLADLVLDSRRLLASDPRDHLYGLVGLWRSRDSAAIPPEALTPNYSKSAEHVFRDATVAALEEVRSLDLWKLISHQSDHDLLSDGIPSWVLKLDRPIHLNLDPVNIMGSFYADDRLLLKPSFAGREDDDNTVLISGVLLGKITGVTEILRRDVVSDLECFKAWIDNVISIAADKSSQGRGYTDIAQVLLAGHSFEGVVATSNDLEGFSSSVKFMNEEKRLPRVMGKIISATSVLERSASKFRTQLFDMCVNRKFFTTENGYLGIGPKLLQPGDAVVILRGGPTPYVLRPYGNKYRLLGECYVGGVMDGEAMRKHIEEGHPDIEFRIR